MAALGSGTAIVKYVIKFARTKARPVQRCNVAGMDPQRIAVGRHQLGCFGMLAGSLREEDDAGDDQSRQNETGARGLAIARSWHGCADELTTLPRS